MKRITITTAAVYTAIALLFSACSAGVIADVRKAVEEAEQEDAPKVLSVQPSASLVGHEKIVVVFDSSMDTGLSFGGTLMAGVSVTETWSQTSVDDDTVTLEPVHTPTKNLWPAGGGKTFTISGSSALGVPMKDYSASFAVEHRIYVNDTSPGNDANAGSASAPKATVAAALSVASDCYVPAYAVSILVAEGTYSANYKTTGVPVAALVEGASIYGGYLDGTWASRDPDSHPSIFQDSSATSGSSVSAANRALGCGAGISAATTVDGCRMQAAAAGQYCAAVVCDGGSARFVNCSVQGNESSAASSSYGFAIIGSAAPEISGCAIDGGTGTTSRGIYAESASPYIHGCAITGGNGAGKNYSIGIDCASSAAPRIFGNDVRAGTTAWFSYGVSVQSSSAPKIYNNRLSGGTGGNSFDSGTACGIWISASSPDIFNNTIDGGLTNGGHTPSPQACAIYLTAASSPAVKNNILFIRSGTNGWGVYENTANADPASVQNNDIFDCGSGLYRDEGASTKTIAELNALGAGYSGNVGDDAAFANQAGYDWLLTAGTPAAVYGGGLDLSTVPDFPKNAGSVCTDYTGTAARTLSWSMGAYEYNP